MTFRRILQHAMGLTIATTIAISPVVAFAKGWEQPRTERSDARHVVRDSDIEIKAARGVIIVTSSHAVQIKVFTILGQLISSETLPAGTHQLTVQAHGVYIVKAGDLTCKVAL